MTAGWSIRQIIRDSGQQLLVMVNELLDISKIEFGHYRLNLEFVDLEEIASACCATLQPALAKKGMSIRIDAPHDLPEIEADARCIRQILLNLLGNAVKFSHPGTAVRLVMRRDGDRLVFEIVDTGIGIARADIERLGQPFVQADNGYDRQREGTGLGLSLVKGMVRLHDGTFQIESALGQGTTVTMRLPLSRGVAATSEPPTVAARSKRRGRRLDWLSPSRAAASAMANTTGRRRRQRVVSGVRA